MKTKKAQGISINMIVVIAIAVFVVFLVLGFATGGWRYFAEAFGGASKSASGYDAAKIKCETWCTSYQNDRCPTDTTKAIYKRLYDSHDQTSDTNSDGELNDCFSCRGNANCDGEAISNVLTRCDCQKLKPAGRSCASGSECMSNSCTEKFAPDTVVDGVTTPGASLGNTCN